MDRTKNIRIGFVMMGLSIFTTLAAGYTLITPSWLGSSLYSLLGPTWPSVVM